MKTPIEREAQRKLMEEITTDISWGDFPKNILREAKQTQEHYNEHNFLDRRDMRHITTLTIDPINAKDFDDALSIEHVNGNIEIGVHIADVSYFITPGSTLDKEAQKRGTSIYLQDRVIPMIPEVLSNDICSLKPNEDRLTISIIWKFDQHGKIKDTWMGRTIIRSDRRFTYEEVDTILSHKHGPYFKEINTFLTFATKLNKKRIQSGSLILEQEEIRFLFDEFSRSYTPTKSVFTPSHMLIEEFMLLANKSVAEFLTKKKYIFPYRIHELPEKEKVDTLRMILGPLGFKIGKKIDTNTLVRLTKDPKLKTYGAFIQSLVLRTLAKARYSIKNKGHFALAFKLYTHFTSPIRRYPDIISHRALTHALLGEKDNQNGEFVEKILIHATERERIAQEAERYSLRNVQIKYMKKLEGTLREAIVTGVTEHGIFLSDVESGTDGLVHVRTLDKSWKLFPSRFEAISKKYGKKIHIGMKIKVNVSRVNVERKMVDYQLSI